MDTSVATRGSWSGSHQRVGKSTLRSVPSNHRTTRVFSVRESLRRRYAPDIQQFAASAQFKLWELKEWLRSHVRTVVVSAKSSVSVWRRPMVSCHPPG